RDRGGPHRHRPRRHVGGARPARRVLRGPLRRSGRRGGDAQGDRRRSREGRHARGRVRGRRPRLPRGARLLRAVGPPARRPARAGVLLDPGDQGLRAGPGLRDRAAPGLGGPRRDPLRRRERVQAQDEQCGRSGGRSDERAAGRRPGRDEAPLDPPHAAQVGGPRHEGGGGRGRGAERRLRRARGRRRRRGHAGHRPRRRLPREVRRRQHRGDPPQLRRLSGQPEKLVARRADRGRRTSASRSRGEPRSGRMTSMIINLNLGLRSYRIVVESGALDTVGARLAELRVGSRAALVSDAAVLRLYGKTVGQSLESAGFVVATVEVPEGEAAKTLAVAARCWDALLDADYFTEVEGDAAALCARDLPVVERIVGGSCRLKAGVVERDERESELRHALNYGHTIGHALEAATGYARFAHGEAVALGIVAEARLALRLGVASPETVLRQERLLAAVGLPVRASAIDADRVLATITRDKKARDGRVPFVLAPRIGAFQLQYDVPWDLVRAVLGELGS